MHACMCVCKERSVIAFSLIVTSASHHAPSVGTRQLHDHMVMMTPGKEVNRRHMYLSLGEKPAVTGSGI